MLHFFFILNINKQGTNHDQVRLPQSLWNILFILFIYLCFLFIFVYIFHSLFFLDILYYDDNKRRLTCTGSQGGKVNFYQVDVIENSKLRLLIASSLRLSDSNEYETFHWDLINTNCQAWYSDCEIGQRPSPDCSIALYCCQLVAHMLLYMLMNNASC